MVPKILLLFDIDGTLLLSGGCPKIALEEAFEEIFGIPGCWGDTTPHGMTDPAIIDAIGQRLLGRTLSPEENKRLEDRYHHLLREKINETDQYRLMPGVVELLEFLSGDKEIFLALGTGNFEPAGWIKLERGKIHHFFRCGGFASDAESRPEILRHAIRRAEKMSGVSFPKEKIYVIGDTLRDVQAAKTVGVRTILVMTNGAKKEDFKDLLPEHFLKDLSHIPTFMACLDEEIRHQGA